MRERTVCADSSGAHPRAASHQTWSVAFRGCPLPYGRGSDVGTRPLPILLLQPLGVRTQVDPRTLDLRVQLEGRLAHLAAEAALLVSTKGGCGVEDVVAVDPHRTCLENLG